MRAHPELLCIDALNISHVQDGLRIYVRGQEVVNLSQVKCASAVAAV